MVKINELPKQRNQLQQVLIGVQNMTDAFSDRINEKNPLDCDFYLHAKLRKLIDLENDIREAICTLDEFHGIEQDL